MISWRNIPFVVCLLVWAGSVSIRAETTAASLGITEVACPYNCSNRGVCNVTVCHCNSPEFFGDGCQYDYIDVDMGDTHQIPVFANSISTFFRTRLHKGNVMTIFFGATQPHAGLELLIKWESAPFPQDYDYSLSGMANSSLGLTVPNPRLGFWFLLVTSNINTTVQVAPTSSVLCANNCTGNGNCMDGQCKCFKNYYGHDCVKEIHPLVVGEQRSSHVLVDNFKYYNLSVSTGNQLVISLLTSPYITLVSVLDGHDGEETSLQSFAVQPRANHSAQGLFFEPQTYGGLQTAEYVLFIAYNRLPTLFDFDGVSEVPYQTGVNFTATHWQPAYGDWLLGIWGNSSFYFTISASTPVGCPNQCQGHGTCQPGGTCQCNPNYLHSDCSIYQADLTANEEQVDTISASQPWKFYNFTTDGGQDLVFELQVGNASMEMPDLQLLLRRNFRPNLENYQLLVDCQSTAVDGVCSLTVIGIAPGNWLVGVYLNQTQLSPDPFPVLVRANLLNMCPNQCSSHGTCLPSGECECKDGWAPPDCVMYLKGLQNGLKHQAKFSVAAGHWAYFSLNVTQQNWLQFQFNRTGPLLSNGTLSSGSAVMYVKHGTLPSPVAYTRTSASSQAFQEIILQGSEIIPDGMWYVGVHGKANVSDFYVSVDADRACARNCSKNGVCVNGECVCDAPYIPSDCSNQDLPIPTNLEMSGKIGFDVWNYYHLTVLGDDALEILVEETNSKVKGVVWVFLKKDGRPTIDDNDFRNQTATGLHTIFVPKARGNWTVGVTGSPRSTSSTQFYLSEYKILALTGCGTLSTCDLCVADENCGWCRDFAFEADAGQCVPGTPTEPLNQTCVYYQYNSCTAFTSGEAITKGLMIGVIVGAAFILAIGVASFFIWRENRRQQKLKLQPTNIDEDEVDPVDQPANEQPPVEEKPVPQVKDTQPLNLGDKPPKKNYGSLVTTKPPLASPPVASSAIPRAPSAARHLGEQTVSSYDEIGGYRSLHKGLYTDDEEDDDNGGFSSDSDVDTRQGSLYK